LKPAGQRPNREHGADDPSGAKPVTAPATVSGEAPATRHCAFGTGRPQAASDPQVRRPAAFPPRGRTPHLLSSTEGETLMSSTLSSALSATIGERQLTGFLVLAFGLLLLAGAGFAGSDYVHNAAHDTRHAIGFPCH
jgi:cobalt transporter subunit CbtB